MTIESEVANLTAQTTALLSAVNVAKSTLDAKVVSATSQASAGAASAAGALVSAAIATGSANSALAIYGTTAAVQAALATAANQSQLAQTAAASASSILSQDLSAVSAALHRSPNAVTAMTLYDTSKDSDGGAWVDRMQHTSWANEPLNGTWRGAVVSESACRAISGAAMGDYFQLTTDGKFYKLNATSGTTEVFRGNKAKFPRLSAVVAEAGNVTIYDLTEVGRPMWMRFRGTGNWNDCILGAPGYVSSIAVVNGALCIGTGPSAYGLIQVSFTKDSSFMWLNAYYGGLDALPLSKRNQAGHTFFPGNGSGLTALGNYNINAVALTILPDAPIDIATGLAVPTIAVATNGGISVIRQDGTVVNWLTNVGTIALVSINDKGQITASGGGGIAFNIWIRNSIPAVSTNIFDANVGSETIVARIGDPGNSPIVGQAGAKSIKLFATAPDSTRLRIPAVNILKDNWSTSAKGMIAYVVPAYNTAYMLGDIRRAYLCNTEVESVSGTELVTNGTFDVDTAGWTTDGGGVLSWSAGTLVATSASNSDVLARQSIVTVVGKVYSFRVDLLAMNGGPAIDVNTSPATSSAYVPGTGTRTLRFTANSTSHSIAVRGGGGNSTATIDNISVKEVILDRSYKAATASIFGSLVKSPVA